MIDPTDIHIASTDDRRRHPATLGLIAATILSLAAVIGVGARGWIGTPFPGFFVLTNGVVPSIGRAEWPRDHGSLYQGAVVAVDGAAVDGNDDVYAQVVARPEGSSLAYTLRRAHGTATHTVPSRTFSSSDYWAIFGAYLGTGILYLGLALLTLWYLPTTRLGHALLAVGALGGLYALSAIGIYGPGASLRLHALVEACLPAAFVALALVFPRERWTLIRPGVALASALSLILAVLYQLLLDQPAAYSVLHAACETYLGVAGLALTAHLLVHAARRPATHSLLLPATAGALLGLGAPAVTVILSGLTGGRLPVNVMTTTAFLFPLCLGSGLLRDGLHQRVALSTAVPGHPAAQRV
jgi:hypothetical protein